MDFKGAHHFFLESKHASFVLLLCDSLIYSFLYRFFPILLNQFRLIRVMRLASNRSRCWPQIRTAQCDSGGRQAEDEGGRAEQRAVVGTSSGSGWWLCDFLLPLLTSMSTWMPARRENRSGIS